jgi:NAD(P)-dependent dehydrogenase (short-subunit alcohol dehydrogenase family)
VALREAIAEEDPVKPAGSGLVMICADSSGVGIPVALALKARGYEFATVIFPDVLKEMSLPPNISSIPLPTGELKVYPIPEASEEAIEGVFQKAIADSGQPLTGFIHIQSKSSSLLSEEMFPKASIEVQKIIFLCAKYFARDFAPQDGSGFFVSAVRMDGKLGLGGGVNPVNGGVFGLHKSVGIELEGRVLSKAVDLSGELQPELAAEYLLDEIFQTGYKYADVGRGTDGKRMVPGLVEGYPAIGLTESELTTQDVLLVTGGGRGITAECVIELAKRYQCGFLLLGRTDLADDIDWAGEARDRNEVRQLALAKFKEENPDKPFKPVEIEGVVDAVLNQTDIRDTIKAITETGGRVCYKACDVRDRQRLKKVLEAGVEELGPITGLVHGAGNIADKKVQRKTSEDFENVFGTKIDGLDACLESIDLGQLKYLILFSSVAGYFGNSGQSDYAMANEVMSKFAFCFKKRYPACQTVSINWGLWDGGSMTNDAIRKAIVGTELNLIPMETGINYFAEQFLSYPDTYPCQIVINYSDRLYIAETLYSNAIGRNR